MITRKKKSETLEALRADLKGAGGVFLIDFSRIKVQEDSAIRIRLHKAGLPYRVAKNTLIRKALHEVGITELDACLEGPSAILVGSAEDPIAPARQIVEIVKNFKDRFTPKITWVGGGTFPGSAIGDVAKLPGRRELQAQVVQLFLSPGATVAGLIRGPGSLLASQIESLIKRLDEAA